ncbi:MAG TPA: cyclic nucleotide-binding domain-containing protein [Steroidobacteraceae bacterium]|nr:cyclic nucleotide-binding domain-containing protein [Steroidobacteraceae bacterium]
MTFHLADFLVHLSNALLLVSYSVRDMLWLRWFAVAAAVVEIPYFLVQHEVLWPPIIWAVIFIAINLYRIARIYMERRPVVLSKDEQTLYDLGFKALSPRDFLSLMLTGEWRDARPGEVVLKEGESAASVVIPISGAAEVQRHGEHVTEAGPGFILGSVAALTGDPSPVGAVFVKPGRYMTWPVATLRTFLDRRPDVRATLGTLTNQDLARKLDRLLSR